MVTMRRLRVSWDGLGGLPGLSTFYYGVASPNVSDCVAFFNAIKGLVPNTLTWTIPSSGDELDEATGKLTGSWLGTGGGTVTGTVAGQPYAAGVGARVTWRTGVVHNGRRVQGRTFIAPLTIGSYDTSGTITTSYLTTLQTAAAAYAASGVAKGIWSKGRTDTDGLYAAIMSAEVPDVVTSLRSRRT